MARAEAEGHACMVGEIIVNDLITIGSNAPLSAAARSPAGLISASGLAAVLAWGR